MLHSCQVLSICLVCSKLPGFVLALFEAQFEATIECVA